MADQKPPTSKLQPPADASAPGEQNGKAEEGKKKLPQLGALEDDDEFEVSRCMSSAELRYPSVCQRADRQDFPASGENTT